MKSYIRTDLAAECMEGNITEKYGIDFTERDEDGISVAEMNIKNDEGSAVIGKPIGRYVTVNIGQAWIADDDRRDKITDVLEGEIKEFISRLVPNPDCVMAAGLGNRDITSDAVGPMCIDNLLVTRHIREADPSLFEKLRHTSICALAPGVVGQTGIETFEIIKCTCDRVSPSLVIVIDALVARSVDRLATTVQLTDTGISPGSGLGGDRHAINSELMGVPVLVIGVPTIVDSQTLVVDALRAAGIEEISDELEAVLENKKSFFVTLKESDTAIREISDIIAHALNSVFSNV